MRRLNPAHLEAVRQIIQSAPFVHMVGIRAVELDYGHCRLELSLEPRHMNPFGGLHGGVYSSAIDTAAYWACYCHLPEQTGFISADLNVSNLSAVREGKLIILGRTIKIGKTLCLAEGRVESEDGRLLAHGTSKMLVTQGLQFLDQAVENLGLPPLPPKFLED